MPREFRCPECKSSILSFMNVGEKATCKACGKSVSVPEGALKVDAPPILTSAPSAAPPEPAKIERLSPEAARLVAIGRQVPPPTTPLYSLGAIYMSALLGTFVAGFLLIRSNFLAVGDAKRARAQLGYMVGVLLLFLAAPFMPEVFGILKHVDYFAIAGVIAVYATRSQGAIVQAHRVLGGPFHSKWRAFWISMVWQAVFLAIFFASTDAERSSVP